MGKITLILLCAFAAMTPFESMLYFEEVPSGAKLLGLALVASALVAFLAGHPLRMLSPPMVMRVIIVLFSVLSLAWTVDRDDTLHNLSRVAQLLILSLLIWEFVITYQDQLWIFRSWLIGMLVPLAMGIMAFRGASQFEIESGERFSGGGHDMNYLAYMCSVVVLIGVYMATNPSPLERLLRWGYWAIVILCAVQVVLTGSRGGLISLVVASVFAMVLAGASRHRIFAVLQVLVAAVLVIVAVRTFVASELLDRITFSGGAGTSIEDDPRMRIWAAGLRAFQRNPLHGVGDGAYATATAEGGKPQPSHNTFVCLLAEVGIPGTALYLVYLVMLFRSALRLPWREKVFWLGIMLVSMSNAVTCGSLIDRFTWSLYTMLLVQEVTFRGASDSRSRKPLPRGAGRPIVAPLRPNPRNP